MIVTPKKKQENLMMRFHFFRDDKQISGRKRIKEKLFFSNKA